MKLRILFQLLMGVLINPWANAYNQSQKDLIELQKNPYQFLNSSTPKIRIGNRSNPARKFIPQSDWVESKFHFRAELQKKQANQIFAEVLEQDQLRNFIEGEELHDDLNFILRPELQSSKVLVSPWSSDYWGSFRGGIAYRYMDPKSPSDSDDYMKYRNHYKKNRKVDFSKPEQVDRLSPAEKYDLLVGDSNNSLTESIFQENDQVYSENAKKIPTWFGICHGWAPASIMLHRPEKSIQVPVSNRNLKDSKLNLRPDDLKALASQLWANGDFQHKQIGGRCNEKNPKLDENGRIVNQDCFDMNPAEWHLLVLHEIGLFKRSFVFDATWDQEVWNQPVHSYKVTYFNVLTGEESTDAAKLLVPLSEYTNDKFKKYRSSKTTKIIGVRMQLKYLIETTPSAAETDSEENDSLTIASYTYDLELDENEKIIGGEWYRNVHPDFAWAPVTTSLASSFADSSITENWSGFEPVPYKWFDLIKQSSAWSRTPLAHIIHTLFDLSKK